MTVLRTVARWLLAGVLVGAGIGHLTTLRRGFRIAVPDWASGHPAWERMQVWSAIGTVMAYRRIAVDMTESRGTSQRELSEDPQTARLGTWSPTGQVPRRQSRPTRTRALRPLDPGTAEGRNVRLSPDAAGHHRTHVPQASDHRP